MTGTTVEGGVRWSFAHLEPYLQRTYKGTTAAMTKVVRDVLAGKAKAPPPDRKGKPGLGPEVKKEGSGAVGQGSGEETHGQVPQVAVFVPVLVGGPLAMLAMLFPTWFVRLALVRSAEAAAMLARAYNDWVLDYCAADRRRLFPCAVLPLQSVEASVAELRRVAKLGFKAAAVRPCFWNGRYPTLPEFDPLWREFEELGVVLAIHTFPSREALTADWAQRIAQTQHLLHQLALIRTCIRLTASQLVQHVMSPPQELALPIG